MGPKLASVDGEVGHEEFIRLATASRVELGKRFDPIRWFCDDDELLRVDGRTYAFSSQWGGTDWLEAMANLRDAFPDLGIAFTPVR